MNLKTDFVLASQSPRRRKLLEQIGVPFTVHVSDVEEHVPDGADASSLVRRLALDKAAAVALHYPEALTLGADTVVVFDGAILGKPDDASCAAAMLRRLRGNTHTVYTGVALVHPASQREVTAVEATDVSFGPLADDEIEEYVASGSPMDKAGSYGIQDDRGALFVSRIEGDYYNVVGLPLHRLYRTMREQFADLMH